MKKLFAAFLIGALAAPALLAQVHVNGYTRKDGTYVAPYYRSSPNSTTSDNYSTRGNVNPYTGEVGTKSPQPLATAPNYGTVPAAKPVCYYNCPK